ncbi:hypothetical protein SH449x_004567 [Pirellulaceae bacterium SH449]
MHPTFTLDFFPTEYYSRPPVESRGTGFISRLLTGVRRKPLELVPVSFSKLVGETKERMRYHDEQTTTIPADLARRESLHGKIDLEAYQWGILVGGKELASLRMVYIHGPKNQIINTWIFPNRPNRMPVYAAELIAVGTEVRVAFVDVQVPVISDASLLEDTQFLTGTIAPRFADLPCNELPPDWAVDASQGNYTYARNIPSTSLPHVEDCYLAYMDAYLYGYAAGNVASEILGHKRDEASIDTLHQYQYHHMEHSPGNKFLSKLFGADWTEKFMRDFLFAKPQG